MSSSYDRKTQGDSSTRYKLISIDKCLSFRDFLAPRTDQILSQSLFFSISLSPFAVIFFSCIPSLSSLFLFFLKIFSFLCVPFFHQILFARFHSFLLYLYILQLKLNSLQTEQKSFANNQVFSTYTNIYIYMANNKVRQRTKLVV